jgi:hypothetical protein
MALFARSYEVLVSEDIRLPGTRGSFGWSGLSGRCSQIMIAA